MLVYYIKYTFIEISNHLKMQLMADSFEPPSEVRPLLVTFEYEACLGNKYVSNTEFNVSVKYKNLYVLQKSVFLIQIIMPVCRLCRSMEDQ